MCCALGRAEDVLLIWFLISEDERMHLHLLLLKCDLHLPKITTEALYVHAVLARAGVCCRIDPNFRSAVVSP